MAKSGTIFDERPVYALTVTGHATAIASGLWMCRADPNWARDVPGVNRVWECIDAVLCRRLGSHRIAIYGRSDPTGIDSAVRAYATVRGVMYFPLNPQRDVWRERSAFRRDLELVGRTHAVLWFGEEESDGDPARIAMILGIPVQVVTTLSRQ